MTTFELSNNLLRLRYVAAALGPLAFLVAALGPESVIT